jgi:hypothetical protein
VVGAFCTQNQNNYAAILNEVFRLQICPSMLEFQEGKISIKKLKRFIRVLALIEIDLQSFWVLQAAGLE